MASSAGLMTDGPKMDWTRDNKQYNCFIQWQERCKMIFRSALVDQTNQIQGECVAPTPSLSLSLASARSTGDRTLFLNKLQQFFYTLSVSQDFILFLDLTYSSNDLSITCILCKTVTSASRTLVIT